MIPISKRKYTEEQWDKHKVNARATYARNRDDVRARRRAERAANPQKFKDQQREYYKRNPERYLLICAKQNARKKGIEFNLTIEDIVIPEYCPIKNIKLIEVCSENGPFDESPSVDRVDNSKGYIKGNIQIISWSANSSKTDLSLEDIERLYKYSRRELDAEIGRVK